MPIQNIVFVSVIAAYWALFRLPVIFENKTRSASVEKKRLRIVGELPLLLSVVFYSLAVYLAISRSFDPELFLAGMTLIVLGILFNEWARRVLGKQWSGEVRIIKEHELITKGPYGVVRNPMYFANAVMSIGCLLVIWSYVLLGLAALMLGISIYRAKVEEKELEGQFGQLYKDYKERTAFIIPLLY